MLAPDPRRLFLRYRRKGDTSALGRVFDIVAPELLAIGIHVTGDVATAEDAVQDTFLTAVEGAHRYDADRPFVPWLVGILINRARKGRDRRRDSRIRATDESGAGLDEIASSAPLTDPAREVAAREVRDMVQVAVGALNEPYRSVVDQHLSECAPPRDIAVTLGRAPGTVRVQLHRGLEQLRELLAGTGGSTARERMSGFGLALPAAAHLGPDAAVRLAAVREVVVQAGVKEAAVSAHVVSGSTFNTAVFGLAAVACVVAAAALRLTIRTGGNEPLAESKAVSVAFAGDQDGELTLAPVEDHQRPDRDARTSAPARSQSAGESKIAPKKRRSTGSGPRPEPKITAPLWTSDFYVEPALDLQHVPDIDVVQRAEFTARSEAGAILAQTHGPLIGLTQVKIGNFVSPDDIGPISVRIDHPGALPATVKIRPQDWFSLGGTYAVRPTVVFDEVLLTARVLADPRSPAPFTGLVQLWSINETGPHRHDTAPLKSEDGARAATLRIPTPGRDWVVFALPASEHVAPEMIVFGGPRSGEVTLSTRLVSRRLPTIELRIVDPFGDPVPQATVRARVLDDEILLRWGPESTPVEIDGWVFCEAYGRNEFAARQDKGGERVRDRSLRAAILPAMTSLESTQEADGVVRLTGAHPEIYSYTIQTSLNDRPVSSFTIAGDPRAVQLGRGPLEVLAPIGGLEITAPRDILANKGGPARWMRAQVTVTAGERELTGKVDASLRARVLVPPATKLTIEIVVPDFGIYEATHPGIWSGALGLVTPVPVRAKDDASEKPSASGAEAGTQGAGGGR